MPGIQIHSLNASSSASPAFNLKGDIEKGLLGTEDVTIPGDREEDKNWAFKRSVPTMCLYDEQGLRRVSILLMECLLIAVQTLRSNHS
jgi:hypothetical protein